MLKTLLLFVLSTMALALPMPMPLPMHSSSPSSTPTPTAGIKAGMNQIWANQTMIAQLVETPARGPMESCAQNTFRSESKTIIASSTTTLDKSQTPSLAQVLQTSFADLAMATPDQIARFTTVVTDFAQTCSEASILIMQQLEADSSMVVHNGVAVQCSRKSATLWWQPIATTTDFTTLTTADDSTSATAAAQRFLRLLHRKDDLPTSAWTRDTLAIADATVSGDVEAALDVWLMLTVASVSRAIGAIPERSLLAPQFMLPHISPLLYSANNNNESALISHARNTQQQPLGTFPVAMAAFDLGVKSFVDALQTLAAAFGSHTKSEIIARKSCLGFDQFKDNVTVNVLQCIADSQTPDFVESFFPELLQSGMADPAAMKRELLAFELARGANFSYDGMQLSNTARSSVELIKVFKNHDDELACSHWVVITNSGGFNLAADEITWHKTSSSWFGFKTKDEVFIQKVPHEISLNDVEAINLFFEVLGYAQLAQARGIPFTYPVFPGC